MGKKEEEIKRIILGAGAHLCGIAPASAFAGAPPGFRPADIDSRCRSVAVFARRVPAASLDTENPVPYTLVNAEVPREVDSLTVQAALLLEDRGIRAVPVPSDDPYEHWEPERSYGRAILSMRHAGALAGLGALGRNTLLLNRRFGSMIQIGALLLGTDLEQDPPAPYEACPPGCRICLDGCPAGALDGTTVDQARCRPLSNYRTAKGYVLKKCNLCRRLCPRSTGF